MDARWVGGGVYHDCGNQQMERQPHQSKEGKKVLGLSPYCFFPFPLPLSPPLSLTLCHARTLSSNPPYSSGTVVHRLCEDVRHMWPHQSSVGRWVGELVTHTHTHRQTHTCACSRNGFVGVNAAEIVNFLLACEKINHMREMFGLAPRTTGESRKQDNNIRCTVEQM